MADENGTELRRHLEETYGARVRQIEERTKTETDEIIARYEAQAHQEADRLLRSAAERASERRQAIVIAARSEQRRVEERQVAAAAAQVRAALKEQIAAMPRTQKQSIIDSLSAQVNDSLAEHKVEAKIVVDDERLEVSADTEAMHFSAGIDERIDKAIPAIIRAIRQRGESEQ